MAFDAQLPMIKQETIAIVAVGVAILGAILITTHRPEDRIDRVVN